MDSNWLFLHSGADWLRVLCFWKNLLGVRHGHICKEENDSKYLWYAISILLFLLKYFDLP